MNEKEIFEMTKHLDDKYVLEASSTQKTKINFKKRFITFGIAAAVAASLSVGAFAAYRAFNKESVGEYYDSSAVEKLENSGYASGQMTQNEHFKFTLETAMKDDYNLLAVVTVKSLDDEAEKFLANDKSINTKITYADTGASSHGSGQMCCMGKYEKGKDTPMRLSVQVNSYEGNIDLSKNLKLSFEKFYEEGDENNAPKDLFKGLSLDIKDIKQSKNVRFYSPKGDVLNVSEFSIAVESGITESEKESIYEQAGSAASEQGNGIKKQKKADTKYIDEIEKTKIVYKDGTTCILKEKLNSISVDFVSDKDKIVILDLRTIIDPDTIDSLEYRGMTYSRK